MRFLFELSYSKASIVISEIYMGIKSEREKGGGGREREREKERERGERGDTSGHITNTYLLFMGKNLGYLLMIFRCKALL